MIVKTLNQEISDNTTYQIYNPTTKTDPVTEEEVVINELVRQWRLVDLESHIANINQEIINAEAEKAKYEWYKTEIESI